MQYCFANSTTSFDTDNLALIGEGTEGKLYNYDGKSAVKITTSPFATENKMSHLCNINTRQITLPERLLYGKFNGSFSGFSTGLILKSGDTDPIYNMRVSTFISNLRIIFSDVQLLTNNEIAITDLGTYNIMVGSLASNSPSKEDSIFLIDPDRFVSLKSSSPQEKEFIHRPLEEHNHRNFTMITNSILFDLIVRPVKLKKQACLSLGMIQAVNYSLDQESPVDSMKERLSGYEMISDYVDEITQQPDCYIKSNKFVA